MDAQQSESQEQVVKAQDVLRFLKTHPSFLTEHPELLESLSPPEAQHGDGVVDFQAFAITSLQEKLQSSKEQVEDIVAIARDNHSMQTQVQNAVLALVGTQTLERFLEVLCVDIPTIFGLDVVRLGLESDTPNPYESYYPEDHYSGMVLIADGAASYAFQGRDAVWLAKDNLLEAPEMLESLFMECMDIARSAAYMHLRLKHVGRDAILAFGARNKGRFADGQATELLQFLAKVTAIRLDHLLYEQAGLL